GFKRDLSDEAFRALLEALGDPTVPRSMSAIALPGTTLEECIRNVLDSDIGVREYLDRAVGGGYRLRGVCQKLGCTFTNDYEQTVGGLLKTLKEKHP
ncbi:MAG TPA: hypothetical protein VMZ92_18060, partial [Planctomycetota bacterium]|nr:hypothetical protein [Planctomycetota bacterium]